MGISIAAVVVHRVHVSRIVAARLSNELGDDMSDLNNVLLAHPKPWIHL